MIISSNVYNNCFCVLCTDYNPVNCNTLKDPLNPLNTPLLGDWNSRKINLIHSNLCRSRFWPVISIFVPLFIARGRFHKRFCAPKPNFCTLRPTFKKLFTGTKVWRKARKFGVGRKTVLKSTPGEALSLTLD